ncbi:MAG: hypothetical protein AAGG56_17985 [Pseudomonadota bacterium]
MCRILNVLLGLFLTVGLRIGEDPVLGGERRAPSAALVQMSFLSAILSRFSSSTPRYRTVLSTLV